MGPNSKFLKSIVNTRCFSSAKNNLYPLDLKIQCEEINMVCTDIENTNKAGGEGGGGGVGCRGWGRGGLL